ncbi:MAG: sigma 54-interacting transcriptional regulator [Betaproteobacteria bacterium]
MKEIVVVAPFDSMTEVTRSVVAENGYSNVDLLEGNLWDGVESAKRAVSGGAKVIISRGGTFELIKAELDIPVVEVKVTAFDLIDSFKTVKQFGENELIGVVGYRNVIAGANLIADVMGLQTLCFEITRQSDIAVEVERMIKQGVRTFLGDGNVAGAVAKHHCHSVLVKSGKQAMEHAIQHAKGILYAARQEKEKAQQFATIIDFVHDGIIAIDNQGIITVFNSASAKITGFSQQEAVGRKITEIIPDTRLLTILETVRPEIGYIQRLDDQTVIATNRIPVVVDGEVRGAVATYQDITEVQKLEQTIRIKLSEKGFIAQHYFSDIVHRSSAVSECIKAAHKFAQYDSSVLICGPSGVGKELFAQGIHNSSTRKNSPFVAINCAALPDTLIESELFGYVEGSFTGATKKGKAGLFELAHGGTIFLDEISELPILLQGRLLRVLQEKQVMRIGDNKLIPVDVRVICATNRDLRSLVSHNQFRGDLYFRIAILNLYIPPLNERADDIELLATHFVEEFRYRYRKPQITLASEAVEYLRSYVYEGNVRELQGMIERAVVICEGKTINVGDLATTPRPEKPRPADASPSSFVEGQSLKEMEECYINHVFSKTNGSIKESSAILGIDRSTLWRRIKKTQAPMAR